MLHLSVHLCTSLAGFACMSVQSVPFINPFFNYCLMCLRCLEVSIGSEYGLLACLMVCSWIVVAYLPTKIQLWQLYYALYMHAFHLFLLSGWYWATCLNAFFLTLSQSMILTLWLSFYRPYRFHGKLKSTFQLAWLQTCGHCYNNIA